MARSSAIAHIAEDGGRVHDLEAHLTKVARKASAFAADFSGGEWAYLAGLWHDIGKYNPEFQHYLEQAAKHAPENAHLEDVEGVKRTRGPDHSTAGAMHALARFAEWKDKGGDKMGRLLAYLIAGHHAGLADWGGQEAGRAALSYRLSEGEPHLRKALAVHPPQELLDHPLPAGLPPAGSCPALWMRMVFSCLTDADFLDTESFMDEGRAVERTKTLPLATLQARYQEYMRRLGAEAESTALNLERASILRQCLEKAKKPPGLFSLTVPTGGGKTLASLGFALEHAARHGKRRIIYVIPYTSIIEQTADVFRRCLGEEAVIEHHSQFDPAKAGDESTRQRLASENWDAPLIVTTTVQFFESLFAARTSRVRKLHNIAGSIVILDEAQLLPPELLDPIRHVMNELMSHYGVTFVISTATQPVLGSPPRRKGACDPVKLPEVQEIVADPAALYRKLQRVEVECRPERRTWDDLAAELAGQARVLCIVSRRGDCRELHRRMPEGTLHLSALMCGAHRSRVIEEIRRLKPDAPVRVVSTQLVEAGVDIDFPVVYRALAGLDSIAQAAGRCNREGRLARGRMVVFTPPQDAPRGLLGKAEAAAKEVLRQVEGDPLRPECFSLFFEQFYGRLESYDKHGIRDLLKPNPELAFSFRTAAERFRLVEDTYLPVLVRYAEGAALVDRLISRQGRDGFDRLLLRKAQRYSVTIPRPQHEALLRDGAIRELDGLPGVYVQAEEAERLYHPVLGFCPDMQMDYAATDLIG